MNNCKGITADSIKADLKSGIISSLIRGNSKLYDKIANKCKLKFKMRDDGGTLLHAMATGKFKNDEGKDVSIYFNNLIKYIDKSKRVEFINILSQIDLKDLKAVGGKTPLDLAIAAGKNNNVSNKPTILLFQKMLEEAIALRSSKKNTNTNSTTSTASTASLSNTTSTGSTNSKTSISSNSKISKLFSLFSKKSTAKLNTRNRNSNSKLKEIVSVICSHESRIKCYLNKFGITDYTKDKVVEIEFYNNSVQKIKIGDSNEYTKNSIKRINKNVNMNNKYIFYIFSFYTDEFYKSMKKDINNIINSSIISSNNKHQKIQTIKNKSVEVMKQKLPENPDYLFSSDLMISVDNIYNIYKKEIIVLPCSHQISTIGSQKCNGGLSIPRYIKLNNLEKKSYINLEYYKSFYKGKGECRNTDFLSNAKSIIFQEGIKKGKKNKVNNNNNYLTVGKLKI